MMLVTVYTAQNQALAVEEDYAVFDFYPAEAEVATFEIYWITMWVNEG
jgi:hypothetical protein